MAEFAGEGDGDGPAWLLSLEEFDALGPDHQQSYLELAQSLVDRWVLTPKQEKALAYAEVVDQLFYGGAAGGGKTDLILYHSHDLSQRIPGHKTLILRTSFPELRRTLIQRAFEKLPAGPKLKWRAAEKLWRYGNGSIIEFGFCTSLADASQYLSAEYDLICVDESSEMPPDVIELLASRLRTTRRKKAQGCRPHLVLCSNPGGIAHHWHKEAFVEATDHGLREAIVEVFVGPGDVRYMTRAFVQSLPGDNPHLDPNYVVNLAALSDPVKRAQYLLGDWDVYEGIFFEAFDRQRHVVDFDVSALPVGWERDRGIDYGYSAPYASLEAAFDQDGRAWVFRECGGTGRTPKMQAAEILMGRTKVHLTLADPACWSQTGIGDSVAHQWALAGLFAVKANNSRPSGWATMRDYLAIWPDGRPGLLIHPSCRDLIRTLPLMQRDPVKIEDLNTKLDDHWCVAAETEVLASEGWRRIDSLRPGDEVRTRRGWRRILAVGVTGVRETFRFRFDDGSWLDATGDHPVWGDGGWRRIDSLMPSGTMAMCGTPWLSPLPSKSIEASGTTSAATTSRTAASDFIARCGATCTALSRRASMSITAMATRRTIGRTTSLSWMAENTSASTVGNRLRLASLLVLLPFHDWSLATPTSPRSNDPKRREQDGRTPSGRRSSASSAGRNIAPQPRPTAGSVASTARCGRSVVAVEPLGWQAVWNLTVDGEHEFFANGTLVHNCDAMRYLLANRPARPKPVTVPSERDSVSERAWDALEKMARRKMHERRSRRAAV